MQEWLCDEQIDWDCQMIDLDFVSRKNALLFAVNSQVKQLQDWVDTFR
jgi:hypothetical protein